MGPSRRTECLQNTRNDILKFVVEWANNVRSEQKMLWIHGLAGSGKSTLTTSIANIFRDSGQLGAFLFFDRDVVERSDPTTVVRTLAHQLSMSDPRIGAAIRIVIEGNPNILMSPLPRQFQKFILEPISQSQPLTSTIVIVIDSFDECGTTEERETLLTVLAQDFGDLPITVRTVITSRPESDICNAFESRRHIFVYELDITLPSNSDDILLYFRHRMSLLCHKNKNLRLGADWPGEEVLLKLVQQASGLFVWASTASRFIDGYTPRKRLDTILRGEVASGAENALDALYTSALESSDDDFVQDFRDILGTVLVARQPLSSTAIDALLRRPEDTPSSHIISLLACLLQHSPTVRVLHPSFADFLTTKNRCKREMWFFDQPTYHRNLAIQCLHRMDTVLQQNMCNMTLSVDLRTERLSEDISYSCLFWIDHICAIEKDVTPIVDHLRDFLFRHLLHWFEAMSILRRSRDSISHLDHLLSWISVGLVELVRDGTRFARVFASSIETHPLLVYMSALPFTPTNTMLYRTFHDPEWYPSVRGGFQYTWSSLQMVLTGHEGSVCSVAISCDGKRIISGSWDKTIRVWDAITGGEVRVIQQKKSVWCIALSRDGRHIAAGYYHDGTVQVWDVLLGTCVSAMRGHDATVRSVNFSPDGRRIVSGSHDKSIRLWDTMTGAEVLPTICGHLNNVTSVAFSPDGKIIVSGSMDQTIRVWDTRTGAPVLVIHGHSGGDIMVSVAFSPKGSIIVSSSGCNIEVWDLKTGALLSTLKGHRLAVKSVIFSPDGRRIIPGSYDCTIRVWDVTTGFQISELRDHEDTIDSVCCSSDGRQIISGSHDNTIRIWDIQSNEVLPTERLHTPAVESIAFTPDGRRVVSVASTDTTVRIWDANAGSEVAQLQVHEEGMTSLACSPDGRRIATGSSSGAVQIWDITNTGSALSTLQGHDDAVCSVAFSPDGRQIATGSFDETVIIWDAISGTALFQPLEGHRDFVRSVTFSSDGSYIISKSDNHIIGYDAVTGRRLDTSEKHGDSPPGSIDIIINPHDWIIDRFTNRTISQIPPVVTRSCTAVHKTSVAVGTIGGRVFVIHFPLTLFTSQDTHTIAGEGRFTEGDSGEEDSSSDSCDGDGVY
ncbi:hypothetical protein PILCRDRAFT_59878 [Piloderma croceum F 1598]|uniref:NACHT domain-containing protein n=1 Tax=Piloderma croceum (strain F 1598) TaxID=765440 RepID=A0A0C3CL09_PILCF|nr:hypothetical protein PILCRDRAFT_59878 [Piloderma croceum F 1598]